MANWGNAIFQIIPTLIGSGLTLFVFNSLITDLNQPHLFLDVQQQYHPVVKSTINKGNSNNQIKFHNIAINDGRSAATHLRLSISYPNYNITDYQITFQSENVTISHSNNTLILELKRLSTGSAIAVDTTGRCINSVAASKSATNACVPYYIVTAAYDQGSSIKSNVDSPVLSTLTFLSSHGRNQMAIIATTFAIISFVIALSIKRIRRFKRRLELSIFAFKILKELVSVRNKLQESIMSQKIFPLES
ncbi:MAG TPA: hypothetical protein VH500_21570 [Nitrososphaeraceae archaeon]